MVMELPLIGGEKESLKNSLDRHREVILWKIEGLSDADLRRPMTPSGLSLLGLVKHLGETEYHWFCQTFGRETEPLPMDADDYHDDDPWITDEDTTDSVLGFYARARAAADEVIAELDLETIGSTWSGKPIALRCSLISLIEETARHAGHADILRELVDGSVGDFKPDA